MVSAAAASKKILGIDRSANPWSDIPKAKVILVAGANIAECAPITTDYLWQARENGAKLIVLDPRMTPIARTADLFIPVRSGGDIGVFYGMLHVMIAARLDRPRLHRRAHHRLGRGRGDRRTLHAGVRRDDRRRARVDDRARGRDVGTGRDQLPAARARHRAPLEGRRELHGRHQPGGRHRPHRPRRLRLRDDHRPGQRPGRARAGPEVRSAARRARHREPGASRVHRRRLGRRGVDHPAHGLVGRAAARSDPRRPHQGAAPALLQPGGLAARRRLHPRSARAASSSSRSSISSCRRRRATPTSCCPAR